MFYGKAKHSILVFLLPEFLIYILATRGRMTAMMAKMFGLALASRTGPTPFEHYPGAYRGEDV
jgi:hypothetical protein